MKSPIMLLAGIVLILGGLALGISGALYLMPSHLFQSETQIRLLKPGSSGGYDALFLKAEEERIQSSEVLTNVIADLALNDVWGKKYNGGQRLSDSAVERMIQVDARPVRNSELIRIAVRSKDPAEAQLLANGITQSYRAYATRTKLASVSIIMPATPPTLAVNPNRPLGIVSIVAGVIMGIGGIFCFADSRPTAEA